MLLASDCLRLELSLAALRLGKDQIHIETYEVIAALSFAAESLRPFQLHCRFSTS
jgi:hypothetical protein